MIGNPYKPKTEDLLLRDTVVMNIAATGNGSASYEVPQGRGKVLAMEFAVDNDTLADLVQASFNLQGNKKVLINEENLITYSPKYANRWAPFLCEIDEKSTIDITGVNGSGTAINVVFTFLYYNPYIVALVPPNRD